jgi:hypothetical protein
MGAFPEGFPKERAMKTIVMGILRCIKVRHWIGIFGIPLFVYGGMVSGLLVVIGGFASVLCFALCMAANLFE